MLLKQVVFLDRDGVINRDSHDYIRNWNDFEFLPRSLEALNLLACKGLPVIVITNQSGIHRGFISLPDLADIHRQLRQVVERTGGRILDFFYCPHHPDELCACRKPEPGLIRQACARYDIDLPASVMVGDSAKDIECGRNAGCGTTILVRTGNGCAAQEELTGKGIRPSAVAADLYEATQFILKYSVVP